MKLHRAYHAVISGGHISSYVTAIMQGIVPLSGQFPDSPLSSRPREFHPQPLSEPYVKVSLHTALRIQIISFDIHRVHILLANDKTDWALSERYWLTNNEQI